MKKNIIFLLIILILGCSVSVYADMEEKSMVTSVSSNELPDPETTSGMESAETMENETGTETEEAVDQNDTGILTDNTKEILSEEGETESEIKEGTLYNVSFPARTTAYLDPGNLSGKGQIFSDRFAVENYGNTDVAIRIKNIDVYYSSAEDIYVLSANKVADSTSHVKKLDINMVWENESLQVEKVLHVSEGEKDEIVLLLQSAEYDENGEFRNLVNSGIGSFYFTGTVNSNPNIVWEDGEVTVKFEYEILNAEKITIEEGELTE